MIIFNDTIIGAYTGYVTKKFFVMPYAELFFIALLFVICLIYFGKNSTYYFTDRPILMIGMCILLFLLQCFFSYHTLFITESWDAGRVLKDAMYSVIGWDWMVDVNYFSYYPNNKGIFLLDYAVCRHLYGTAHFSTANAVIMIMRIEAFISAITAYLIYRVTHIITNDAKASYLAWVIYALLLGLSGWVIVPYTDMTVILLPLLIYYIYLRMSGDRRDYIRWFFIAFFTAAGFIVKPTVAIMLIAIVIGMIVFRFGEMISKLRSPWGVLRIAAIIAIVFCTMFSTSKLCDAAIESTGMVLDEEKNTGPLHMLMMGLNDSNDGAMTWDDIAFSQKFETKSERTAAQLDRIEMIFRSYRPSSFISHLSRKALVVFNDGTFAWGEEGGFYDEQLTHTFIGSILKSFTYKGGNHYIGFSTIFQIIWYMVLLMLVFVCRIKCDEKHIIPAVAVVGIIIFNLLFEARARYLIVYAPVIIVVAVTGLLSVWSKRD